MSRSVNPSQSSSIRLAHTSRRKGLIIGFESSQSPAQVVAKSPSSSNPSSISPLQLLSKPSQASIAKALIAVNRSSQSMPQVVIPSPSSSTSSSAAPSQSSSIMFPQLSAAPGKTVARRSLQSPSQLVYPSVSKSW